MKKKHIVYLTEEEIKALANAYRVAMKMGGEIPYMQDLQSNGGQSAFDKLMKQIEDINGSKRE